MARIVLLTPNADYATWVVQRPIVVDLDDTLGNGGPTVYVPRDLWISYAGTTSVRLTAANAFSDRLPGNYCAISVTKYALADSGPGQTLYWDFADNTVKRAVHPDAPATVGRNGYLLLITLTGSPVGAFTSPNGLPVVELTPKTHVDVLADVRASLFSKLRSTHVTLIGDSITWGLTASDNGPLQPPPRTHQLTDRRDIITSSSWANKLRKWAGSVSCGLRNESQPAPGESLHQHTVDVAPYSDPNFTVMNASNQVLRKYGQHRNGPLLKSHLDIQRGVGNRCVFEFEGTGFTLYYAAQHADDTWTIEVDGVEVVSHATNSVMAWQQTEVVSGLSFGRHRVELINQSADRFFRVEAVRFEKTLRFSNNGLIGTNTEEWLPTGSLLDAGVPIGTTHLFIQMGGNDRAQAESTELPAGVLRTSINLRKIVNWLKSNRPNARIVLMATSMTTEDEQSNPERYNSSMDDLAREIAQLSDELGCGFIDNYTCTNLEYIDGVPFLADNIHPNDNGHKVIARNIISAITRA